MIKVTQPLSFRVEVAGVASALAATALVAAPTASAAPGDLLDQDAATLCVIMVENQTPEYVFNALATLKNEDYTLDQAIQVMNYAVNNECPYIRPLVADALAQLNQGILGG